MSRLIPPGTLWMIEAHTGSSYSFEGVPEYPVRAFTEPTSNPLKEGAHQVFLEAGSVLVTGGTHSDFRLGIRHDFVEVLLPIRCFINRTLFNEGLGYLRRIS